MKVSIRNLVYLIVGLLMGGLIGTASSIYTVKVQQDVIIHAIDKQTTSIANKFGKIKTNKSYLQLDLDNKAQTNINDSLKNKRNKFWKFNRNN
jgi:hypothetical protein